MEKRHPLQQVVLRKLFTLGRQKVEAYLSPDTKMKYWCINDIIVRPKTLKLVKENIGKILEDIGIGNYFLNQTPIAQEIRARVDKWDFIKLKSFCTSEELMTRVKR
jgi:hypothetical protein